MRRDASIARWDYSWPPTAKPTALYHSARAALVAQIERGRDRGEAAVPASAGRGALAGVEALLVGQVLAEKGAQLDRLAPEILYLLAVPYLGRGEAQRLAAEAIERPTLRAVA